MPEVTIKVGGRDYVVACQAGEEQYLQAAAGMLDAEASALAGQGAHLPESRLLLMAGLMLADKTAGLEDQLRAAESRAGVAEDEAERLRGAPAPEPERVEVAVIPEAVTDTLAELAARAEAMAATVEEKVG
ncbi:MAG: cell division protein ZapA [Rhodobacter sp.]|nr:cell division protein ZapA [Rhodobacter sp.]